MRNPVTFSEMLDYLAYRQAGQGRREAAQRVGRSPGVMSRFDRALEPNILASGLEGAILEACETAATRFLPTGVSASDLFTFSPGLLVKVQILANGVLRAAKQSGVRLDANLPKALDSGGDVAPGGFGVHGG